MKKSEIKGFYDDSTEEQLIDCRIDLEEAIVSEFCERHPRSERALLLEELNKKEYGE